jgi:hypothetical protein
MPPWRCETWARPIPLSVAATRLPGRLPRTGGHAARGLFRVEAGTREYHPAARMLSIRAATSSISRRSSSSASSAATSAARAALRCSRAALSRIAWRIASDLLRPVASSCANARRVSGSRRTLIAEVTSLVYHDSSYRLRSLKPWMLDGGKSGRGNRPPMTSLEGFGPHPADQHPAGQGA